MKKGHQTTNSYNWKQEKHAIFLFLNLLVALGLKCQGTKSVELLVYYMNRETTTLRHRYLGLIAFIVGQILNAASQQDLVFKCKISS